MLYCSLASFSLFPTLALHSAKLWPILNSDTNVPGTILRTGPDSVHQRAKERVQDSGHQHLPRSHPESTVRVRETMTASSL
jgi:hypothetical protein